MPFFAEISQNQQSFEQFTSENNLQGNTEQNSAFNGSVIERSLQQPTLRPSALLSKHSEDAVVPA